MKLLWSKPIPLDSPWEPACAGVFCKRNGIATLLFKDGRDLCVMTEESESLRRISAAKDTVPLPNRWILSGNETQPKLFLNETLALDVTTLKMEALVDTSVYSNLCKPERYYQEAVFAHDGYEIFHKGHFGYQCIKDGTKIWEFRGQGYLYTDICFRQDRVFFGTAGQGGYFYVLDLKTGAALLEIKTGGTASFDTDAGLCYVLTNGKTAKLLCVDLAEGSIHSEAELPGNASVYSRLKLMDGRLHAVTFTRRKGTLHLANWNCIQV